MDFLLTVEILMDFLITVEIMKNFGLRELEGKQKNDNKVDHMVKGEIGTKQQ